MPVLSCGGMRFQESWDRSAAIGEKSQRNLERTVERAFELGINHFETARGYGTSEAQLGPALARLPRERIIVQTKVGPEADPKVFERNLEESFECLRVEVLDLFAFHGLNNPKRIEHVLRRGGCYEVADRFRREGRIRHVGFSTHAPTRLILECIETDLFDYVNLHWYYIFQDNLPAIEAARRRDMGVFIISPSDKGGMLYKPPRKLIELCRPLSPIVFNDLFCLSNPAVHTISVGAARPEDFDEHLRAVELLDRAGELLPPILERLEAARREALGPELAEKWLEGLPDWEEIPGGINVRSILWLWSLARAFDLVEYARMRYGFLGKDDHWFPGNPAADFDEDELVRALRSSPHAGRIPGILREAHGLLAQK